MRQARLVSTCSRPLLLLTYLFLHSFVLVACDALSVQPQLTPRNNNPLNIDWDPAPPPDQGPPLSRGALRDPAYLPAQIGGIVGAYALSLVLVASLLLILSKKRREHLAAADDEIDFDFGIHSPLSFVKAPLSPRSIPRSPVNFSYPTQDKPEPQTYVFPSPASTLAAPGVDFSVDQRIVAADRNMAQQQLEEMYKYVMEQEEAKANGVVLDGPPAPLAAALQRPASSGKSSSGATLTKKERNKPAALALGNASGEPEKHQSRTSSILSALRSPRKKTMKGISISSPIMTPMSGTFPSAEAREMNTIPPRHYAPAPPPPVPTNQAPFMGTAPLTPEYSPRRDQSIDSRMGSLASPLAANPVSHFPPAFEQQQQQQQQQGNTHSRNTSHAPTIDDPISPATDSSQLPLVGLPTSPKPGVNRFPSLPLSPRPENQSFPRANAPSAVRTGGALPLRAYEPAMMSPSAIPQTTQTVFQRMGPLSPTGAPYTGAAVPYSPYQPFTPCVPMTPSLVTKADRKRMRRLEPKTPTLAMVRSDDEVW